MLKLIILFYEFFKIGLFTIGGGHAMIPMIKTVVMAHGWIATSEQITRFIGIAEGSPGPFAVNIATFIGFEQAGFLGAFFATIGVVLPSWIIIVLIASKGGRFLETKTAKAILNGLSGVVIGLICITIIGVIYENLFQTTLDIWKLSFSKFDIYSFIITILIFIISLVKYKNVKISPILLIILSGLFGYIFYQVL